MSGICSCAFQRNIPSMVNAWPCLLAVLRYSSWCLLIECCQAPHSNFHWNFSTLWCNDLPALQMPPTIKLLIPAHCFLRKGLRSPHFHCGITICNKDRVHQLSWCPWSFHANPHCRIEDFNAVAIAFGSRLEGRLCSQIALNICVVVSQMPRYVNPRRTAHV